MPQFNRLLEHMPSFKNVKNLSTTDSAHVFIAITLIFPLMNRGSWSHISDSRELLVLFQLK